MIVLLSPAKTLNYEDKLSCPSSTTPMMSRDANTLAKILHGYTSKQLQKLMSISAKIGDLNYERYQEYSPKPKKSSTRQALLAYRGDVYQGFSLESYKKRDYEFAQKSIRILSGLYGYLRPLDLIQPYRLEMKTKLKNDIGKDLYAFWGDKITKAINKDLKEQKTDLVINLASKEYSSSVQFPDLNGTVITVDFKVKKGKELKTVGLFAKRARGLMTNYIVQERLTKAEDLKGFRVEGYRYLASHSTPETMVFSTRR